MANADLSSSIDTNAAQIQPVPGRSKLVLERRRQIRAETVRRKQREARNRTYKTPEPVSPHAPAQGTIGWVRRQFAALGVMLHTELKVSPNAILVATMMVAASNELGETDVGQRRLETMTGLSLSSIYRAWVELQAVGFFKEITVPDHYRKERRAGTHHMLDVPRDEKLSTAYVYPTLDPDPRDQEPARLARRAQRALQFEDAAPGAEPPTPRPATPQHTGGNDCPCRPCRAMAEALNQENESPVNRTGEASLTVTLSVTEDVGVVDEFTSLPAMLTSTDAPNGAIDATPDPIDQPPTRGGSNAPTLTTGERAAARAIDREIARKAWAANAPRKRPTAFEEALRVEYEGQIKRSTIDVSKLNERLSKYLLPDSDPHLEGRAGTVPKRTREQSTFAGHSEGCYCKQCEDRESVSDKKRDR